jgi:aminoglycoside phosphotransferase (APT) family kinase protein
MVVTGGWTLYEAVRRFFVPFEPDADAFTFLATLLSAFVCLGLWVYQRYVGLRSGSMALITQSVDSCNHVIVAASVTAGLVALLLQFPLLDTLVGLAVALLILKSAIELVIEVVRSLGEESVDLSRFEFGLVYERFRQAQLREMLMHLPELSEAEIVKLLSSPLVRNRLGGSFGEDVSAISLSARKDVYRVTTSNGDWILRFPRDGEHLSVLRKEERIGFGLRERITLRIPDTRVIADLDGIPAFAIHRVIPGEPLTTDLYLNLLPAARDRLIGDLARFFCQTHGIPLHVACEWLGIPFEGERTVAELASARKNHAWFGPDAIAEMRPLLEPLLDADQGRLFEDTARLFGALETTQDHMVFGHGDIHGYNVATGQDDLGYKIVGVFDLGCAGILDIHEDFFRLSLVSEELVERVMAAYQALPGQVRPLDRDRIAIYYRAFLFYLMVDRSGSRLCHLKRLLSAHVQYYDATYGGLG